MTQQTFGQPRTGRRTELRRRRRQRRRRNTALALGVAVLVLLATTLYFVLRDDAEPVDAGQQVRTQKTLLLQVRTPAGDALVNALLARDDKAGTGAVVLIPSQLLVTVSGSGSSTLAKASSAAQDSTRNALSDLVGVVVDSSWALDVAALTRLVDGLGGIRVDVDVPVLAGRSVLVDAGRQELDGARAAAFATYLAAGEQEQARLARVQELLNGVLTAVRDGTAPLPALLTTLGASSVSTLPPPDLADFLTGLADDDRRAELQYDVLPVVPIDLGNGVTAFRIDLPRSDALVDRLLAQSIPPGRRDTGNRVLVLNGVGQPNIAEAARAKLLRASFVFAGKRNADRFGYAQTLVLVPESTVEDQRLGERVAQALGVPPTSVRSSQSVGSISDVIVILGKDFTP